jgi:hypothetical protein
MRYGVLWLITESCSESSSNASLVVYIGMSEGTVFMTPDVEELAGLEKDCFVSS